MSVILFSAEELGNVASYLGSSRYLREEGREQIVRWLAEYSVGNAWAFHHQYGEEMNPISVEEIRKNVNVIRFDREQARSTLRLLMYNGLTNAGAETRLAGYFEAMARLMDMAYARLADDFEASAQSARSR